jgi:hypothetical protein
MQSALGRKVLRKVAPLTRGAQHVHDTVDDLAHIDLAATAAMFGLWNQRFYQRPFCICEVARIAQLVAVVFGAVFVGPHLVAG